MSVFTPLVVFGVRQGRVVSSIAVIGFTAIFDSELPVVVTDCTPPAVSRRSTTEEPVFFVLSIVVVVSLPFVHQVSSIVICSVVSICKFVVLLASLTLHTMFIQVPTTW